MGVTMSKLRELSLDELADSLREQAAKSAVKDVDAWNELVRMVNAATEGDRVDLLTANRKWLLQELSVEGFRGVKHQVSFAVDNPHGITVLFGENGSGKSSLAEAVRVALEGRTSATHLGATGSVHELWGSLDQRSQGVDTATVVVDLADEATMDRLTIRALITSTGVERHGVLESQGERIELKADSPAWRVWADAIRASPPVLAYAELADELQKKRDLQVWLTSCLAMDNASRIFEAIVQTEVEAALSAEKIIRTAREEAARAISVVDAEAKKQGVEGISDPVWADDWNSTDDLNAWLQSNDIVPREKRLHVLDREAMEALPNWGIEFAKGWKTWSEAATTVLLTAQVTDALVSMHERVLSSNQGDNGGACPTCGSLQEDWRDHLHAEAKRYQTAQQAGFRLKKLVRESPTKLLKPLKACLVVLRPRPDVHLSELSNLVDAVEVCLEGDDLDVDLLSALGNLAKWVQLPTTQSLFAAALEASGLQHQWRCHRWDATAPLVAVFESHIERAARAGKLKRARSRWNSHLKEIRKARSSALHALVDPAVSTLLGDVGISVSTIEITKTESRLDLVNSKGQVVELAHLSAGQRNALILGPVIATAESGIFGFSILDDPVHAFDDFRVDKLSSTLAELGRNQALILTTHDARFVSYLRVHAPLDLSVLSTHRDGDGRITLTATKDAPAELVEFAGELAKDLEKVGAQEGRAEITAILRMALDEAFEQLALRHFARKPAVEAKNDRATLNEAMLTNDRKKVLRSFMADSPSQLAAFTAAWQLVAAPAKRWSRAVHDPDDVPDAKQLEDDVAVADQAVTMLRGIRW